MVCDNKIWLLEIICCCCIWIKIWFSFDELKFVILYEVLKTWDFWYFSSLLLSDVDRHVIIPNCIIIWNGRSASVWADSILYFSYTVQANKFRFRLESYQKSLFDNISWLLSLFFFICYYLSSIFITFIIWSSIVITTCHHKLS